MFLNFEDNRPDTPRVPQAFTRLERTLLAVVAYQFLVLGFLLAPESFGAAQMRELVTMNEPLRYIEAQPVVEPLPAIMAPPAALERPAPAPAPTPPPAAPASDAEPIQLGPADPPRAAESPQPVPVPPAAEPAPPAAPRVPGGILGSALRNLDRYVGEPLSQDPEDQFSEDGPSVQFDPKGVDFGPWLRRFRAQVYRNWLIPQAAMVMRGHVVIQMIVRRDGTLTDFRIIRPSGIEAFDTAALNALRLSSPTMQLPDAYPGSGIDPFTVIFYYNEPVR